jgi:hypothetical protein
MGLLDLASAWIRATSPFPVIWKDFETRLDDALGRKAGCSFMLGSQLTKSGSPYAAYCHAGELFTFALTPKQAQRLALRQDLLVCAAGCVEHNHEPRPEPLIHIEEVSLDKQSLNWEDAISGSFKCSTGQPWLREMCLQVAIEPPGFATTILWSYFGHLPPGISTQRFSVSCRGLSPANAESFAGVLPLFIQIGIMEEEQPQVLDPWHPMYGQQIHAVPEPFHPAVLGDPYLPPSTPFGLPPGLAHVIPPKQPVPPSTAHSLPKAPAQKQFKAVSDIRAVLVELGART